MKRLLIASSMVFALTSGSAFAADLPPPAYKAPPPPAPTWTGCYITGGVGYGLWNQDHWVDFAPANGGGTTVQTTDGGRGWLGRFGGGCDYQFGVAGLGNFTIGAFGDYDVMGLSGTISLNEILPATGQSLASNENESGAWYAGVRLGYLITPSVNGFVSGGWTQTRFGSLTEYNTGLATPAGYGYSAYLHWLVPWRRL